MVLQITQMNEALLQSYNDTIRVFPALPNNSTFVSRFTLLAKGGFLVSSEKEAGEIKYVGIKSLYGLPVALVNPWPGQQIQVRHTSDNSIITTSSENIINFSTIANNVYVVERTLKKLETYLFTQLTANPNGSAKTMTYNSTTLTLGSGQGNPVVEVFNFDSKRVSPVFLPQLFKTISGKFIIPNSENTSDYYLLIYSLNGRLVAKTIITQSEVNLRSISGISNGTFLVKINPISKVKSVK